MKQQKNRRVRPSLVLSWGLMTVLTIVSTTFVSLSDASSQQHRPQTEWTLSCDQKWGTIGNHGNRGGVGRFGKSQNGQHGLDTTASKKQPSNLHSKEKGHWLDIRYILGPKCRDVDRSHFGSSSSKSLVTSSSRLRKPLVTNDSNETGGVEQQQQQQQQHQPDQQEQSKEAAAVPVVDNNDDLRVVGGAVKARNGGVLRQAAWDALDKIFTLINVTSTTSTAKLGDCTTTSANLKDLLKRLKDKVPNKLMFIVVRIIDGSMKETIMQGYEDVPDKFELLYAESTPKAYLNQNNKTGTPPECSLTEFTQSTSDETLRNFSKTSVLFVSVSFIILMVISLAWLVFYYVQRFRYAHAKDRLARRLFNAAKKTLTKIPTRAVRSNDKELDADCPVCIEPYHQSDIIRTLPCKHVFHKTCVDPWLLEHRTCPMCKSDILKAYGYNFNQSEDSGHGVDGVDGDDVSGVEGGSSEGGQSSNGDPYHPYPYQITDSDIHDPFFPSPAPSPSLVQQVLHQGNACGFSIIPLTVHSGTSVSRPTSLTNTSKHGNRSNPLGASSRHRTSNSSDDSLTGGGRHINGGGVCSSSAPLVGASSSIFNAEVHHHHPAASSNSSSSSSSSSRSNSNDDNSGSNSNSSSSDVVRNNRGGGGGGVDGGRRKTGEKQHRCSGGGSSDDDDLSCESSMSSWNSSGGGRNSGSRETERRSKRENDEGDVHQSRTRFSDAEEEEEEEEAYESDSSVSRLTTNTTTAAPSSPSSSSIIRNNSNRNNRNKSDSIKSASRAASATTTTKFGRTPKKQQHQQQQQQHDISSDERQPLNQPQKQQRRKSQGSFSASAGSSQKKTTKKSPSGSSHRHRRQTNTDIDNNKSSATKHYNSNNQYFPVNNNIHNKSTSIRSHQHNPTHPTTVTDSVAESMDRRRKSTSSVLRVVPSGGGPKNSIRINNSHRKNIGTSAAAAVVEPLLIQNTPDAAAAEYYPTTIDTPANWSQQPHSYIPTISSIPFSSSSSKNTAAAAAASTSIQTKSIAAGTTTTNNSAFPLIQFNHKTDPLLTSTSHTTTSIRPPLSTSISFENNVDTMIGNSGKPSLNSSSQKTGVDDDEHNGFNRFIGGRGGGGIGHRGGVGTSVFVGCEMVGGPIGGMASSPLVEAGTGTGVGTRQLPKKAEKVVSPSTTATFPPTFPTASAPSSSSSSSSSNCFATTAACQNDGRGHVQTVLIRSNHNHHHPSTTNNNTSTQQKSPSTLRRGNNIIPSSPPTTGQRRRGDEQNNRDGGSGSGSQQGGDSKHGFRRGNSSSK